MMPVRSETKSCKGSRILRRRTKHGWRHYECWKLPRESKTRAVWECSGV